MPKMRDHELLAIVGQAKDDAVVFQGEFIRKQEEFLQYYLGCPLGNEIDGQSQVISTDCADVVDSDMTSLVRMFLGPQELMEFTPRTGSNVDIIEAEQKTQYINHLVKGQSNSFKILHDWMKDALIQKISSLKYEYFEEETVREYEYDGLDDDEITLMVADFDDDVEIIGRDEDEGGHFIRFKVKRVEKGVRFFNIPSENFLISRNAENKDDAELVGDKTMVTRGELVAQGFDEDIVKSLPSGEREDDTSLPAIRFSAEGGLDESEPVKHWASEEIEVFDLYVKVDYDGDGLVERRRIIMAGNKILENERHEHVPFAIMSATLMPHTIIGRSRVEITQQTQDIKTALYRQVLNNIYRVNNGRVVVNEDDTNIDDLLVARPNGIVRTRLPDPRAAVAQLETPYVGDKALQIVQYVDAVRQQTTGGITANQGLDSDQLHKETATRFAGVEKAATAKVEHIARVFAETGFKDLFDGMAWLVSHYHNDKVEILYNGDKLLIDPRFWRFEHNIRSNVGLAASSNENIMQNLGSILSIHQQLKATGSPIVDDAKTFNVLDKVVKAMGLHTSRDMFNDPTKPEELLAAENEQLRSAVEQLQAQIQQNPLAEAEQIRAQAKLIEAQSKNSIDAAKLQQDMDQFIVQKEFDYTELEVNKSVDVPNRGVEGVRGVNGQTTNQ